MAAASYRISETATMELEASLVTPQAPRPVAKKVPSPKKGPLAPDVDGGLDAGGAAVLDDGAGCFWCVVDEGAGVKLWIDSGATMGEGAWTVEEEEGR